MTTDRLNDLIAEERSFAIYRVPGSHTIRFISQQKSKIKLLHSIEKLNGQSGFVIAPFNATADCPIVLMHPDAEEIIPAPKGETPNHSRSNSKPHAPIEEDYEARFRNFIAPIQNQQFQKLVLSRRLTVDRAEDFSPGEAFLTACSKYIHSYVYLFHTPETGAWLGCTPELLLSGERNHWTTVALAGTQTIRRGALPNVWDGKNYVEQLLVTQYIRSQLTSFGILPEENGPYAVRAGELAHLQTDFDFTLADSRQVGDLLSKLHPTPAVAGLPKEEALRFILNNEGYDRRYYSGFVGWLEPGKQSDVYVNLRCMNILPQSLVLYAGGGLLASSTPENEWRETEAKLKTVYVLQ
jgi:isochorismate synthase